MVGLDGDYVLVVDDVADVRDSLALLLEASRIPVVTAADGLEALALLHASQPPAAILLDLQMPGLTGEAFLAEHEATPALCTIPVVVLTADADPDLPARLPGACAVLRKPADPAALLATIRRLLAG